MRIGVSARPLWRFPVSAHRRLIITGRMARSYRLGRQPFAGMFPGIMGSNLSSIAIPAKTVLVEEFPALDGYSWHLPTPPGEERYNNAPNMISFVDGHVSYVTMYSGSNNPSHNLQSPFVFNPPAGYDYKWSAD